MSHARKISLSLKNYFVPEEIRNEIKSLNDEKRVNNYKIMILKSKFSLMHSLRVCEIISDEIDNLCDENENLDDEILSLSAVGYKYSKYLKNNHKDLC